MARTEILIVEDDHRIATLIQSILTNLGYLSPVIASSGEEAVDIAISRCPDLVLMDIMLPGKLDGVETVQQIVQHLDIPVVYLTAYVDEEMLERVKRTKPFGYILKPFDHKELQTSIEIALYKHKIEKKLREHEQWLSATLSSIGEGVIATNRDGVITLMNPVAERLTGWPQEEGVTQNLNNVFVVIDEETQARYDDPVAQIREGSCVIEVMNHSLLLTRAGWHIPIEFNGSPITDNEGNFDGLVLVFQDISRRKQAEEKLRAYREHLEQLVQERTSEILRMNTQLHRDIAARKRAEGELRQLEIAFRTMQLGVTISDLGGKIIYTNPAEAEKHGYHVKELLGQDVGILAPPELRQPMSVEQIRNLTNRVRESVNIRKDGTSFPVRLISDIIKDERGEPIAVVTTCEDISEYKAAEHKLQKAIEGTILAMVLTSEMRDPYTAGHQRRVSQLALAIAHTMGLSESDAEGVRMAAVIHDLGKIYVPAEILSKPGQLAEIEFSLIKHHPQVGYDILRTVEFPWPIAEIVLQHHERIDGSGYPQGLQGDEILLEARIVSVADVIEAMSSHRPYRPALGIERALDEISRHRGILYDAEVVDVCLELFQSQGFHFSPVPTSASL